MTCFGFGVCFCCFCCFCFAGFAYFGGGSGFALTRFTRFSGFARFGNDSSFALTFLARFRFSLCFSSIADFSGGIGFNLRSLGFTGGFASNLANLGFRLSFGFARLGRSYVAYVGAGSCGPFGLGCDFAERFGFGRLGTGTFALAQLGQDRFAWLGAGSCGPFGLGRGFAEHFGSNPFTLARVDRSRFAWLGVGDFDRFGLRCGFAERFGFGRLGTGDFVGGGAHGFRCLGCCSRCVGPNPVGSVYCFSVGSFGFAGAGEGLGVPSCATLVSRVVLFRPSFWSIAGLVEVRGVHVEVVVATVHIVRLGFGRRRGAGGVAVGSIAELSGDVPESAWRPHGPNPPRGHPVVSPMVAYVV
ncbi:hypothetical protein AB0K15_13295 [Amycolatopsis sp. NPDC049253]|uniref:hypothetical protein n=1 Tax=Amycolatopsis sp. NPDC049253 TaxID=3155274 RepID=UPI0034152B8F